MWSISTSISIIPNKKKYDLNKIAIAAIDIDELQTLTSLQSLSAQANLESPIVFHKPVIIEKRDGKKKRAVAHCVHMLRNLNEPDRLLRLFDWMRLQKEVGYDKIRLYTYQVDESIRKEILKFDPELISIADFDISYESFCKYQINMRNKSIKIFFIYRVLINYTYRYIIRYKCREIFIRLL